MKKIVSIILTVILCALGLTFGLTGCKKNNNVIRLNEVTHSVFYAPLYIAINNGYFQDEGLAIELTDGKGANNSMTAILSKQADIGLMGPEAAIYVYNGGKSNYPTIFGGLTTTDGSFIVSRQKIDNFQIKDMENKEILGGRKGGVPAMSLEEVLRQNKLINGQNININYDVKFELMVPAFTGGTGDFVTVFEPTASMLELEKKGYIVTSVGEHVGRIPFTAFMALDDYIANNPKKIDAFMRAIMKGMDYVATNTSVDIAKALAPSFPNTNINVLASSIERYKSIGAYATTPTIKQEDFDRLQQIIINAGIMNNKVDFNKLVDNSIAERLNK